MQVPQKHCEKVAKVGEVDVPVHDCKKVPKEVCKEVGVGKPKVIPRFGRTTLCKFKKD